jgi:hypothetical protein
VTYITRMCVDKADTGHISDPNFGHLNLSTLYKLRSFKVKVHDVNAICDSLESIHYKACMEKIVAYVYPWTHQAFFDTQVMCVKEDIWPRLGRILTGSQFSSMKRLDVHVPPSYGDEGLVLVERSLAVVQGAVQVQFLIS